MEEKSESIIAKMTIQEVLAELVAKTDLKADLKAQLDKAEKRLATLKERVLLYFEETSVTSMKALGKTIYLHRQIWAGREDEANPIQVVDELKSLNLGSFININAQSVSGYVRQIAKDTPGFTDKDGHLIKTTEELLNLLPGKLPTLLKITEKFDVNVRK
jgi:hypothetical protein